MEPIPKPQPVDDEFEKLQRWFRPKQVRRLLQEYHAIHDPWMYEPEEERGIKDTQKRVNPEPAIYRLADLKACIDWAMTRLAVEDPLAHMVIYGLYVDRYDWDAVSADTGIPVHRAWARQLTVHDVEDRGVVAMCRYLGWERTPD
jgi:hypothetical protein